MTTKLIENMMWAISSVAEPVRIRSQTNIESSAGADHDLRARHRDHDQEVGHAAAAELWRTSARAIIVPRIVETIVASAASSRLVSIALFRSGMSKALIQLSSCEALPGEVELAARVVEREGDDHRDRQQRVDRRQDREDHHAALAYQLTRLHLRGHATSCLVTHQRLLAGELDVDRDGGHDQRHHDERERRRGRVVLDVQVLRSGSTLPIIAWFGLPRNEALM